MSARTAYVMLEDEELQAVALESARTVDIECFVPADTIGWIWYFAINHIPAGLLLDRWAD